ncbi:DUF262 domain-containing protein [Tateyamaria sp.]|uniref:GmrSD restriction endonuclease domain-containing protein n=1 Tax=Tateyamaria sp. TaxID=1929288 RepID=UPI00329EDDE3
MKEIRDLFEVSAISPEELSQIDKGPAGYKIPEYQRPYDWDTENVHRLVVSMFAGLQRLSESESADAYTFIGTLIFVEDNSKEPTFKEQSYLVVDGQQRVTTLSLLACAVIENLRSTHDMLPSISPIVDAWLESEVEFFERSLIKLVVGKQDLKGDKSFPFPRIIREGDNRGKSIKEQELKSSISKFLVEFFDFYSSDKTEFVVPKLPDTRETRKILENFTFMGALLNELNEPDWHAENDCKFLSKDSFKRAGIKNLLSALKDHAETDGQIELDQILLNEKTHEFFRSLLFASYLCNCVGITVVTTSDESAAFDIFDALNTTGEPLSALEVLKPVVVSSLNGSKTHAGYKNSSAQEAFNRWDQVFEDENYTNTQEKQDETKRTIVTAALVTAGEKIAEKLSIQRAEIRKYFRKSFSSDEDAGETFVSTLADVAEFRRDYWNDPSLSRLNILHSDAAQCDELKFLFCFLQAMKTPMSLPILFRYWRRGKQESDFKDFLEAVRAVTAFLALRRAATEKTDGIDSCFRDLMAEGTGTKKYGFCSRLDFSNKVPSIPDLKAALRANLTSKKLQFSSPAGREKWVEHCVDVPMYSAAQPLAKFMIFASHNKTAVNSTKPWLLKRSGVISAADREFMTYATWTDPRYKTVEHVAPNSAGAKGWPTDILNNARVRNTLGNLTLLPMKENAHISNAAWNKKRLFFDALVAKTDADRTTKLTQAETVLKQPFRRATIKVVKDSSRLGLLDGIADTKNWDKKHVEERSRRLLELAWDEIWPWLDG